MSDKIRKYVLPNLPYLFVFWFFSKIGTAYRIAPGTDFGTKLMGMLDTFPKAFETYWPGLGGIDLLVGLAGAAGVYLLIQSKIRQAKKFRRDAEYGTARFGTKEDIKPFVGPKIPANARNLNACVIGSSGSGKTRFWLTPQLLQAHSSYVVVDPKGGTLDQCGRFLQREKYRVRVFNSIDFSKSMHYNPLA
ncbi:type IV secretory system conjugative DNA transfer family protein, partial [Coprococcus comes]